MDTNPIFDPIHDTEAYRDSRSTIDKEGNRVWIYPKNLKDNCTTTVLLLV